MPVLLLLMFDLFARRGNFYGQRQVVLVLHLDRRRDEPLVAVAHQEHSESWTVLMACLLRSYKLFPQVVMFLLDHPDSIVVVSVIRIKVVTAVVKTTANCEGGLVLELLFLCRWIRDCALQRLRTLLVFLFPGDHVPCFFLLLIKYSKLMTFTGARDWKAIDIV